MWPENWRRKSPTNWGLPMSDITVSVSRTEGSDDTIPLPAYETDAAAGMDLRANFPSADRDAGVTLAPGGRALVPTGLRLAIPSDFEAQIRPRSGLAFKHGITLANTPGTIDSDYRGPLGVILINLGTEPFHIAHGDRIAQILFAPVVRAVWDERPSLDDTGRGAGGFGSTGRK
jgi:dUTP pyrophosphatase